MSLPYPGCEFFRQYRDNNYQAQDLVFDWTQAHVDASIVVPEDPLPNQLPIKWDRYKVRKEMVPRRVPDQTSKLFCSETICV